MFIFLLPTELFTVDPRERLGSPTSRFGEVLEHSIFADIGNEPLYYPSKLSMFSNIHDGDMKAKYYLMKADEALPDLPPLTFGTPCTEYMRTAKHYTQVPQNKDDDDDD